MCPKEEKFSEPLPETNRQPSNHPGALFHALDQIEAIKLFATTTITKIVGRLPVGCMEAFDAYYTV